MGGGEGGVAADDHASVGMPVLSISSQLDGLGRGCWLGPGPGYTVHSTSLDDMTRRLEAVSCGRYAVCGMQQAVGLERMDRNADADTDGWAGGAKRRWAVGRDDDDDAYMHRENGRIVQTSARKAEG